MTKSKAKPKRKRICRHDTPGNLGDKLLFRCRCGNVWIGGEFQGSVPQDQGALSIFGAFLRGPAVPR
jgi:hypothetical protein